MSVSRLEQPPFVESPSLRRQVTPVEARQLPIHNWFVYPHSFSPGLVAFVTQRLGLTTGATIMDPFVGAGTTLLCAKEMGFSGIGVDLLPVSVALTRAKVACYDIPSLEHDIEAIAIALEQASNAVITRHDRPETESRLYSLAEEKSGILAKAFDDKTITLLTIILEVIDTICSSEDNHRFCLVGLLALLEEFSATRKAGGWLKIVEPTRRAEELPASLVVRLNRMLVETIRFQSSPHRGEWTAMLGDARRLPDEIGPVDAVISSPPYLNRHDYTRVLGLELLVGFLTDYAQMKDLRYSLLRSHVEAKPVVSPSGYIQPGRVAAILERLSAKKTDKRVLRIIDGYFEDMFAVLRSVTSKLIDGGWAAFVLGNVRFGGITIEVDEIVAELGRAVGLRPDSILVARRRNNSAQQMRDYGRDPARESVVIWQAE